MTKLIVVFSVVIAVGAGGGVCAGQQDFSRVEITSTKVAGNLYTLAGQGGTIGVLAGPDGVLLVDSQFAPLSDKIVAAIKQISDGRIRFLINTHVHGDHTGGNENFVRLGVTILARENLRARLAKPNPQASGQPGVPAPPMALPVLTYDAPMTIRMNGEEDGRPLRRSAVSGTEIGALNLSVPLMDAGERPRHRSPSRQGARRRVAPATQACPRYGRSSSFAERAEKLIRGGDRGACRTPCAPR